MSLIQALVQLIECEFSAGFMSLIQALVQLIECVSSRRDS